MKLLMRKLQISNSEYLKVNRNKKTDIKTSYYRIIYSIIFAKKNNEYAYIYIKQIEYINTEFIEYSFI